MDKYRKIVYCLVVCVAVFALCAGCRNKSLNQSDVANDTTHTKIVPDDITAPGHDAPDNISPDTYAAVLDADIDSIRNAVIDPTFTPSDSIAENGFWKGIRAIDYVEMFDYSAVQINMETLDVSEESIEQEIGNFLYNFPDRKEITDRAVEDGDLVNIDFVGSINGVMLENLSTGGQGEEVVAGSPDYIDDFLMQIIGHNPGETINVYVTYPEDFGKDELNGKDAVFVTTINSIIEESAASLSDEFVMKKLSETYGWTTVAEMSESIAKAIRNKSIHDVVFEFLTTNVSVKALPRQLVDYQIQSMFIYYKNNAESMGMNLEEYTGKSPEELAYDNLPDINARAVYYLVNQAIAEDVGLSVSEADLKTYAAENIGSEGYLVMVEQYGLPFVKQAVLCQKVANYIIDKAEQI